MRSSAGIRRSWYATRRSPRYGWNIGTPQLVIAAALAVLWFAFQRLAPWRREGVEVPDEVDPMEGGHTGDLRTIPSGALGRLRLRPAGWPRGRDTIGRLYLSMLHRAAGEGLPRPLAATPLEFALRLEEHFGSPTPGSISRAFAEARYGRRPPPREETERLRAHSEVDSRRDSRARQSSYRSP